MSGTTNIPEVSVVIRKGNKMLFILREHTGYADGMYALPSGHVEYAEPFSAAAIRETLEEVGVIIHVDSLQPLLATQRLGRDKDDVRVGMFFEATKWSGTPKNMEPAKHGAIAWFDADNLPYDKIMGFQSQGLKALARGDIYCEMDWDTGVGQG
jgi:ADP-ribose pyrophosphatase YjhB (NUDIX family)